VSYEVVAAVLRSGIAPPSRKLVAVVLAEAARPDGSDAWPGRERLRRYTGLSDVMVRQHIAALIDAGVVREDRRAHEGVRRTFSFLPAWLDGAGGSS
jgi:hypothetical protein